MSEIEFSVVIPTFNRAKFIERTILSVLAQTFTNFELIIVDDGSTDDTGEVVQSIDDGRITYHYKSNEERAAARNAGARLARGKYVTFLDSDDVVYSGHLQTAMQMVDKYNRPEWFHLGYELVSPDGKRIRSGKNLPEKSNGLLIEGNHLSCDGVFLRRDIAARFPFTPDRALSGTEDYELWLRLASRYSLYCTNQVTSAIVDHDGRSVVTTDLEKLVKRIELLEKHVMEDEQFMKCFGKQLDEFRANNRLYISLHLALSKSNRVGALRYLVNAVLASPKALGNKAFYGTIKRLFV
jgi:glycosyltransferase involved in cell wall biosynthesis